MSFLYPWILGAFPVLAALLVLLERWRRQPVVLVVADLGLFASEPVSEEEARAAQRRLAWRFWARLLALALLVAAASGARVARGPRGALVVDLVLDRGISSSAAGEAGQGREGRGSRLADHRRSLSGLLDELRPDDQVRLHLAPGPGPRLLSPAGARIALQEVRAAGAEADLERVLLPLLAQEAEQVPGQPAQRVGRGPVFCATDRDPGLGSASLALALSGAPYRNRGVIAFSREGTTLHAALLGAPGPVSVSFAARGAGGGLLRGSAGGELVAETPLVLSWSDPGLAQATEASVRITAATEKAAPGGAGPGEKSPDDASLDDLSLDDLSLDDRAFAVAAPLRSRRVGLLGRVSPALLKALRAVPGVSAEVLEPGAPEVGLDLLVASELPKVLPELPLAVVPLGLPPSPTPGGELRAGTPHPVWTHSLARLLRDPARVPLLAPLPSGLPDALPVLFAGDEPLILATPGPRPRVVVCRAPGSGSWTQREVFPLLWAELLEALAPPSSGELRAHPAGEELVGPLPRAPWGGPQRVLVGGELVLGTVARPAVPPSIAVAHGFRAEDLGALSAARPPAPQRELAPWLALLAFPLLLAAGWPSAPPRAGAEEEAKLRAGREAQIARL